MRRGSTADAFNRLRERTIDDADTLGNQTQRDDASAADVTDEPPRNFFSLEGRDEESWDLP